jgi:hypothetical protein
MISAILKRQAGFEKSLLLEKAAYVQISPTNMGKIISVPKLMLRNMTLLTNNNLCVDQKDSVYLGLVDHSDCVT